MDVPLVRGRMHVNRDVATTGRIADSGDGDVLFDRFARGNEQVSRSKICQNDRASILDVKAIGSGPVALEIRLGDDAAGHHNVTGVQAVALRRED